MGEIKEYREKVTGIREFRDSEAAETKRRLGADEIEELPDVPTTEQGTETKTSRSGRGRSRQNTDDE